MMRLVPKYRRLAALLILLVVLALPLSAIVSVIDIYRSDLREIEDRKQAISRLEAIAHYDRSLGADHGQPAEADHAAWFLAGNDAAIAGAGLQAKLKELAQLHGVNVPQARDLKPRLLDGVTYVGVGIAMSGASEGVASLLQAIESSLPLLIIDEAQLRAEMSGIDARYDPIVIYVDLEIRAALAGVSAKPGAS